MSDVPPGSAIVTPAQMYDEIKAIHQGVIEIRGELREVTRVVPDHEERLRALEQREDSAEVVNDVQDHETRIRGIERALWLVAGFAASGGGVVGSIVTKLLGG